MKVELLEEPQLEFGNSTRHVDIRFGIKEGGTLDFNSKAGPRIIKIGFVGTYETIEGISNWLRKCAELIPAIKTKQPNLRPEFPGFNEQQNFHSKLHWESTMVSTIGSSQLTRLKITDRNLVVREAVALLADEIEYLADKTSANVIICAPPLELLTLMNPDNKNDSPKLKRSEKRFQVNLDFHDLLKATLMMKKTKVPIQIVLPPTYDESKKRRLHIADDDRQRLQDEATRAWNLHTAIYYKAGGKPWRLVRDRSQPTSCYIGVSFFKSLDRTKMYTSTAQVFDERGEGVIVRGGTVSISNVDLQPHLTKESAHQLLTICLQNYRREHRTFPARVVLHKSSSFNTLEVEGFLGALEDIGIDDYDFISLNKSNLRLYRGGLYPPMRGTLLTMDEKFMFLHTRGSVKFFETYTGNYPPRTLRIDFTHGNQTPRYIAEEILALTKMNWNNTQFDGSEPITLRAARQVGEILKYVDEGSLIQQFYRFYM